MQQQALIDAFANDDLRVIKKRALAGSTVDHYYQFVNEEDGVLHIALDEDEAVEVMQWLRDEMVEE